MYKQSKFRLLMVMLIAVIFTMSMSTCIVDAQAPGGNRSPVIAQGDTLAVAMNEDETATVKLSASDADKNNISWSIITIPSNGTASLENPSGSRGKSQVTVSYKPSTDYYGADSIAVQVSDGKGGTDTITINVTVNPVNDEPVNAPPVNTVLPSVSGTAIVGNDLTADTGVWEDEELAAVTYTSQWQTADDANGLNAADIPGETASTYKLTEVNANKYVRIKVTATDNQSLSTTAYSTWMLISPTVPPQPKIINYVSLGDSIATGTVYPSKAIASYVTYFYQFLQEQNSTAQVNLSRHATDGNRTNELYVRLGLDGSAGDSALITAVQSANIITISMGGNNLMQAAQDPTSYSGYDFYTIDEAKAEQGVADFNTQWEPIICKIKELNSNAQIIVTTVYNPYNEADTELHNAVDSYLFRNGSGINDIISSKVGLGYEVADVFSGFNNYCTNMDAITYFYPSQYDFWGMLTRNPHPNAQGQSIINDLHKQAYRPIN